MIVELVQDFAALLAAAPAGHTRRRVLGLLDEAIRRDLQFLMRHSTALFQCLWNLGGWHDDVRPLLERWFSQRTAKRPWLRSVRPPVDPLGSGLRWVFPGLIDRSEIRRVILSADGDAVGVMGLHQAAHCDLRTGRVLHTFDSEVGLVDIAFREGGGLAAVERVLDERGRQIGTRTWNVADASEITGPPAQPIARETPSADLPYAAVERDGQVEVSSRADGRLLYRLPGDEFFRPNLKFTADFRFLVQADSHLTIWDLADGSARARVRASESAERIQQFLSDFILSPDGRLIIGWGRDGTVRVWAISEMRVQPVPRPEADNDIVALRFDGPCWLRARGNVGPRELDDPWPVWDARTGTPANLSDVAAILLDPVAERTQPTFAADARRFAAVLKDGRIVIGDSATPSINELPAPDAPIARLVLSPDGRWLAGIARDTYAADVWDLATGARCARVEHTYDEPVYGHGPMEVRFEEDQFITSAHVFAEPGDREAWLTQQVHELPSGRWLAHRPPQLRRKRFRRLDGSFALGVFGLVETDEFIPLEGEGPWCPRFDGTEAHIHNTAGAVTSWFPLAPRGHTELIAAISPDGQTIALALGNQLHLLVMENSVE